MSRFLSISLAIILMLALLLACTDDKSVVGGGDKTTPMIVSLSPTDGATEVPPNIAISATFSERLDPTSINVNSISITGVNGTVSHIDSTLTFTPSAPLKFATTYTVTVSSAVADLSGNRLDSAFTWSFTTHHDHGNPVGKLYVLNQADTNIQIYDSHTFDMIKEFTTPVIEPHFIIFSDDLAYYYVVGRVQSAGIIAKYNSLNDSLVAQYQVSGLTFPTAVAVGANNDTLYMTDFNVDRGHIHKFIITGDQLTFEDSLMQAGEKTHDVRKSDDGRFIVSAGYASSELWVADVTTGENFPLTLDSAQESFYTGPLEYGPYGVEIDHNSQFAYVACRIGTDQIRIFDLIHRTLIDSIMVPVSNAGDSNSNGPTYMALHPDNNTLFVTTQTNNSLEVIRLSTREVVASIPFSTAKSFTPVVSVDGSRVYVSCTNTRPNKGMVYVIDGNTYQKLDSITVGSEPFGIRWRP